MLKLQIRSCLIALFVFTVSHTCLAQSQPAAASTPSDEPIAVAVLNPTGVTWLPHVEYSSLVLTISTPSGGILRQEYRNGTNPSFSLMNQDGLRRPDGHYTYELRMVPVVSAENRATLAVSRDSGKGESVGREFQGSDQIRSGELVQTGFFLVSQGAIFSNTSGESANPRSNPPQTTTDRAGMANIGPLPNDQVTTDDIIVQGSACIGLDCVNNESFGFDTLRLKENNTRITFTDTSTSAGFPNNVWTLTANDSVSGGANKFSIDDVTGAKTPFTIIAGAPTNSFFLNNLGRLGLRTATPALDIHMNTSNTPAIRFEQNSGGGFTSQTWDIGANEANFFVRDFTGGSRLPFRIRPGAPTSSIDIAASGNIGVGTASPAFKLDVVGSINATSFSLNGTPFNPTSYNAVAGITTGQIAKWTDNAGTLGNSVISEAGGNVGIGTASPVTPLEVKGAIYNSAPLGFSVGSKAGVNRIIAKTSGPTFEFINSADALATITARAISLGVSYETTNAPVNGLIVEGNVGIGTSAPNSTLQVNGYIQLALTPGAPPTVDCDDATEYGRMKVDATANKLYVCTSTGWKSTTLVP